MSIPFLSNGMVFATSGATYHTNGVIADPLQKAGVLPHAGPAPISKAAPWSTWNHANWLLGKIPGSSSSGGSDH